MLDNTPIIAAINPMDSGVNAIKRAEAAGIISNAIINNTPTTLIPTATTIARDIVIIKFSFFGLKPLADAKSSLRVTSKRGDQRHIINENIIPTPIQIIKRSILETANISPIKYAIRSILTPEIKETITSPAAIELCPATPKSVSIKSDRPSNKVTEDAIIKETNTAPANTENSKVKAYRDKAKRDPKKDDLTMFIRSLILVYLHIPR